MSLPTPTVRLTLIHVQLRWGGLKVPISSTVQNRHFCQSSSPSFPGQVRLFHFINSERNTHAPPKQAPTIDLRICRQPHLNINRGSDPWVSLYAMGKEACNSAERVYFVDSTCKCRSGRHLPNFVMDLLWGVPQARSQYFGHPQKRQFAEIRISCQNGSW